MLTKVSDEFQFLIFNFSVTVIVIGIIIKQSSTMTLYFVCRK